MQNWHPSEIKIELYQDQIKSRICKSDLNWNWILINTQP